MAEQQRPTQPALPDFVGWPTFPFEGNLRVKRVDPPAPEEPARQGEGGDGCAKCAAPDSDYIWTDDRWRVRALGRPSGLPAVVVLETRHHYDMGDLSNLLAAELGVLTVRLERAIRSIDGVARVHVNRWGDGSEHLHVFFLARPKGMLQLRGTFLSMWDDILPPIPEEQWRENLAFIAVWLEEYGGRAVADPPPMHWDGSTSDDVPSASGGEDSERSGAAPAAAGGTSGGPISMSTTSADPTSAEPASAGSASARPVASGPTSAGPASNDLASADPARNALPDAGALVRGADAALIRRTALFDGGAPGNGAPGNGAPGGTPRESALGNGFPESNGPGSTADGPLYDQDDRPRDQVPGASAVRRPTPVPRRSRPPTAKGVASVIPRTSPGGSSQLSQEPDGPPRTGPGTP